MARLPQIGFAFGDPAPKQSGGSDYPREHPRNTRTAAASVHAGFIRYCAHFEIPTLPCNEAYRAVMEDNRSFGFYFKKKKSDYDPESNKKFF